MIGGFGVLTDPYGPARDNQYRHVILNYDYDPPTFVRSCKLLHSEPISFLDCPVASRWTLVRAK